MSLLWNRLPPVFTTPPSRPCPSPNSLPKLPQPQGKSQWGKGKAQCRPPVCPLPHPNWKGKEGEGNGVEDQETMSGWEVVACLPAAVWGPTCPPPHPNRTSPSVSSSLGWGRSNGQCRVNGSGEQTSPWNNECSSQVGTGRRGHKCQPALHMGTVCHKQTQTRTMSPPLLKLNHIVPVREWKEGTLRGEGGSSGVKTNMFRLSVKCLNARPLGSSQPPPPTGMGREEVWNGRTLLTRQCRRPASRSSSPSLSLRGMSLSRLLLSKLLLALHPREQCNKCQQKAAPQGTNCSAYQGCCCPVQVQACSGASPTASRSETTHNHQNKRF